MNLTTLNIQIHPKWVLIDSSPNRLVYKSPLVQDPFSSIEIINEDDEIYGLIKSSANKAGSKVILGKGISVELTLMLMVDVLAEGIFDYDD